MRHLLRNIGGLVLIAGLLSAAPAGAQDRDDDDDQPQRAERFQEPFGGGRPGEGPPGFRPFGLGPRVQVPGLPPAPGESGPPREDAGHRHGRPPRIDWELLRKYDPEMFELEWRDAQLEQQCLTLSEQARRTRSELRGAIRDELSKLVAEHFDVRQQRRRLQLKRLEEELASAREAIERRDAARDELVARRLGELTGDLDPLDF